MPIVLGIDSSTQSTKVELRNADDGTVLGRGRAAHPAVSPPRAEQDPTDWWDALVAATRSATADAAARGRSVDPASVAAIAVGGQQHGLVALGADDRVLRPAKLWNDTTSAGEAAALVDRLDAAGWAAATGSVPVPSFTITKVAWLARHEPAVLAATRRLLLPHDWLTLQLCGRAVTDRGDASGTGYWSPAEDRWRPDLLDLTGLLDGSGGVDGAGVVPADGWLACLPEVLGPLEAAGTLRAEAAAELGVGTTATVVGPGTGDNMAAALGVGLRSGELALSLGTSGTAFTVTNRPLADPTGAVAGFADATGAFLPLVCTLNATLATEAVGRWLGLDLAGLDAAALAAEPGSGGVVLVPHLVGERTPNRPHGTGTWAGLRADTGRAELARSAFEGVVCSLLDGVDAMAAAGAAIDPGARLVLVGGGARSAAYPSVVADLTGRAVTLPDGDEHVVAGAAVQAAAVLRGGGSESFSAIASGWRLGQGRVVEPHGGEGSAMDHAAVRAGIRARFAAVVG